MSITRINEFKAQEGHESALRALIESFLPMIESSDGCQGCQLLQGLDDPTRIVVIEVWDNPEAHLAAVKNVPPGVFAEAMKLLAGPPKGEYYRGSE